MNTRKSIFALFLGWSGATVLLTAYFLTLFSVVDLTYVNLLYFNPVIENIGKFLLQMVNVVAIVYFCTDKNKFVSILSYIPIYFISGFIPSQYFIIPTLVIPLIFIFTVMLINKLSWKNIIYKLIIFTISLILISFCLRLIRFSQNGLTYIDTNLSTVFINSIDLFIGYLFLIKVVKPYVYLVFKFSFLSKVKSIFKNEKPSKESLDTSDLNARQKALFAVLVLGYQLFQIAVVLAIGFINNMFIELLVMLLIFWIGRTILQKSWHSDKLWICSVATFSGFYILTKITPPFEISLFLVVALTGAFIYILHILGVKADRLEELEEKYETDFTKYGLSAEMAKFAYDWLTDGMRDKELMIKYEINSVNTLNSRKRRIKQAMNTK